nr:alginate export family protein [Phenylobacterium sp.]
MKRTKTQLALGTGFAALLWAGLAQAQAVDPAPAPEPETEAAAEPPLPPAPEPTLSGQIAAGRLLLEVRARYEGVDQTKTAVLRDAGQAFTVRTRLGWETADFKGFKGLIEFEDVRQIGPERFAVNVPGALTPPLNGADKVRYPIVNDPDVTELNRAQLTWSPSAALQVTAGRQRILLDDQRFVGNVGWRQDEQTFDSVRADFA